MPFPSAAEVAASWTEGMGRSTEKIRRGVNRVVESPGAKAAAASDLWQQRVSSEDAKRKFQTNVGSISTEEWKRDMLEKGIGRIAGGANAAKGKFQRKMSTFLPFLESVTNQVRAMPKATLEDRIARAAAQIRGTAAYRSGG